MAAPAASCIRLPHPLRYALSGSKERHLHRVQPPAPVAISPIEDTLPTCALVAWSSHEEDRENEGDLILAADHVSAEAINFMARFTVA